MSDTDFKTIIQNMEKEHQFALSKISHEIRNPVTLINSFLQLIESEHPEIRDFRYWGEIMENMEFLKTLLAELSDYNNSKALHVQEINPYKLLENLVASVAPRLSEKNITITLQKKSAIPLLSIDLTKLREALLNLIRNSVESMPAGGQILLSIFSDGLSVTIEITDNGYGIPEEYLPTLFDAFVTHKRDGSGLGLAIVKNVVESHNGYINVSSELGRGTTFSIVLPT